MNFRYAITLAQTLYDVEGDTEDLEEIGLVAYNFIGNKNTHLNKIILDVNCTDGSLSYFPGRSYCMPVDLPLNPHRSVSDSIPDSTANAHASS